MPNYASINECECEAVYSYALGVAIATQRTESSTVTDDTERCAKKRKKASVMYTFSVTHEMYFILIFGNNTF